MRNFFLFFFLLFPQLILAQEGTALVKYVKGEVSKSFNGERSRVVQGEVIGAGYSIETGANGLAVLKLEDGSTVKLDEGTNLKMGELIQKDTVGEQENFNGSSSMVLEAGSVFIKVIKKFSGEPSLKVKNSDGIAMGVRGTEFFTGIDEDDNSLWTSVNEGEVMAIDASNDDYENIKAGESLVVEGGKVLTRPGRFQWAQSLNWNMDHRKGELRGGFFRQRAERRKEMLAKIKRLRQRKKRPVGALLKQWKKMRGKKRRPLAQFLRNRKNLKERFQNSEKGQRIKEGMKKRFKERRKRRIGR